MTTRLFVCNPRIYADIYNEIEDAKNAFKAKKQHISGWLCGNMKNIEIGDVAYFMRVNSGNEIFTELLIQ